MDVPLRFGSLTFGVAYDIRKLRISRKMNIPKWGKVKEEQRQKKCE
jgi:hypothetical protein